LAYPKQKIFIPRLLPFSKFTQHKGTIIAMLLLKSSNHVLSLDLEGNLIYWDLFSQKIYWTKKFIKNHLDAMGLMHNNAEFIEAVSSPIGNADLNNRNLSESRIHTLLNVRNLKSGNVIKSISLDGKRISTLQITIDDKYVLLGYYNGDLAKFDLQSEKFIYSFQAHDIQLYQIKELHNNNWMISSSADFILKLWDIETGLPIRRYEGHEGDIYSFALTLDEKYIITASGDESLKVWDLSTGNLIQSKEQYIQDIYAVQFSPDESFIVSGGEGKSITVWDFTNHQMHEIHRYLTDLSLFLDFTEDGQYLLQGGESMRVWKVITN
jgi:WD40 repeat protein